MTDGIGPIRVLLLEPDSAAANLAKETLARDDHMLVVGIVADQSALVDKLGATYAQVAVLDIGALRGEIGPAVRDVLARVPECCVIVTGANAAPGVISSAVTAGARGFILKPYEPDDFIATIRDAYVNLQELRRLQRIDRAPGIGSRPGTVISVYSPKGGVGCTTIATNLAVALSQRKGATVAIVDLDLQFGDVGVALDLRSANSIADLLDHVDAIDRGLIDEVFIKHASGVRALLAPESLAVVPSIDPERVARMIDQLRPHFQFIICDLWSSLEELTLATLRLSDRILVVTTPELPALRNIRRVSAATGLLLEDERTLLIANRVPGKAGVSVGDIEKGLGRPIAATIASDGVGITQAINRGISMLDDRSRARAGKSYRKLAELIVRGLEPGAGRVERRTVPTGMTRPAG